MKTFYKFSATVKFSSFKVYFEKENTTLSTVECAISLAIQTMTCTVVIFGMLRVKRPKK